MRHSVTAASLSRLAKGFANDALCWRAYSLDPLGIVGARNTSPLTYWPEFWSLLQRSPGLGLWFILRSNIINSCSTLKLYSPERSSLLYCFFPSAYSAVTALISSFAAMPDQILDDISHRRYNPLTDSWLLVSPHRTKRPWQ